MESNNQSIVVYFNKQNLLHRSLKPHPEHPQRILYIKDSLEKLAMHTQRIQIKDILYEQTANEEEYDKIEQLMKQTHNENYWEFVKEMWHEGIKKSEMYINMDTYFMKDTYHAAREAVRTTVRAVDQLLEQEGKQIPIFVLVRPPGHHCGMKSQPHGFSFFNNIAIATNYIHKLKESSNKIAIVDWDVHHGEGTQAIFYDKKNPLFISLHRYDNGKFFPHIKQSSSEFVGEKHGEGYNINICWNLLNVEGKKKGEEFKREETVGDEQYAYAFSKIVLPVLQQYNPDYILVSCGFDSAKGDIIGGLQISPVGYAYMTRKLLELKKKVLFVLQGGYTQESLITSSSGVVNSVIGNLSPEEKEGVKKLECGIYQPNQIGVKGVKESIEKITKYWDLSE